MANSASSGRAVDELIAYNTLLDIDEYLHQTIPIASHIVCPASSPQGSG